MVCIKHAKKKMEEHHTEYYRRLETTRFSNKLKYKHLSASIGNFRKTENERSHLPLCFTEPGQ